MARPSSVRLELVERDALEVLRVDAGAAMGTPTTR